MRIVLGLLGCVLSLLLIIYRVPIRGFIGQIDWAERKLGPGGTYSMLVIIGFIGFVFSLVYMTDSFGLLFGGDSGVDFFDSAK
ncbi:hypothetical protein JW758_02705 [Candidatus Peregrinibacteria bacterium]|nr:hypothetical protein [Candidatus Peregrinibacteria bacterium]